MQQSMKKKYFSLSEKGNPGVKNKIFHNTEPMFIFLFLLSELQMISYFPSSELTFVGDVLH